MADSYAETLNRTWDDLPEPAEYLPVGTWLLKGRNVAFFEGDEDKDQSARVVLFFEAVEPMDDVSETELQALGEDYDFSNNDVAKQVYINREKDWQEVRKILNLAGVDTEGKTQAESFKEFRNSKVLAYLTVKTYNGKDGLKTTNDPINFAAAE